MPRPGDEAGRFEFWNWPEFTPAFVEWFAQALDGRPVRLVAGTF
ncbi:hypothetical protein [Actinacidiphila acidipaludis]|nr:hypothetical protein [Streptomyces acidipaludis]